MSTSDNYDEYHSALILSRSTPPDIHAAYDLLTKAAENGDDRAIYAIATWHLFGNDIIEKNEERGVSMLLSLEKSNIAEALFDIAVSYDHGRHVERDTDKAFSFYMRSALLGDKSACDQISQFYAEGIVVQHDEFIANAWKMRSEQDEISISPPYRRWIDSIS